MSGNRRETKRYSHLARGLRAGYLRRPKGRCQGGCAQKKPGILDPGLRFLGEHCRSAGGLPSVPPASERQSEPNLAGAELTADGSLAVIRAALLGGRHAAVRPVEHVEHFSDEIDRPATPPSGTRCCTRTSVLFCAGWMNALRGTMVPSGRSRAVPPAPSSRRSPP